MRSPKRSEPWQAAGEHGDAPTLTVGRLVAGLPGELLVDIGRGPRRARRAAKFEAPALTTDRAAGASVLVLLEDGDPERPIVLDFVVDPATAAPPNAASELDVRTDGRRVVIEAEREILLRCGKSYILIREDGQVVVKGTNVVSHATGANKIKGGSVRIN
jgi:uncharacterized protein DUF6484